MDLVTLALAKSYIDKKINEEGIVTGATPQQAAQIEQNKTNIADLQTKVDELKAAGIPTDEHINSLIDDKLGVIENGTY